MPSDKRNLIMAKDMDCSTLLHPWMCLLAHRSMYNTFFMVLPGPSFVSHSSSLTTKGVDFVVGT